MPKHSSEYPIDLPIAVSIGPASALLKKDRLGILLKSFVGEDIGVRKGGDNDVQRLAAVWRLVVGVLHPKEQR
jgi:hypothetical protein